MSTALARIEQESLAHLEGVIERGLGTFVEVGEALAAIRDERLYRQTHGTFEDYCRERWGFTDRYARHLIAGAEIGTIVPVANEAQARELAPLRDEPQRMAAVWQQATERAETESRPVTANDVRVTRMAVHYSSATDEWATPQDFYDEVDREFGFDLDVCALPESAKCSRYFGPKDDGLAQEWDGTCWMNPPYGTEIGAWVKKAHDAGIDGATVVCLLPARVDTGWWWDYCRYGEIRFLRGRLKFGGADTSAPFPSALVVFGPDVAPSVVWWERGG